MVSRVVQPRTMSPLRGVRERLYFVDSIADKDLPFVRVAAYPTQDHSGFRP
jgi:hypothetical protein